MSDTPVTDEMVEAAWWIATDAVQVGAGDGNTHAVSPPDKERMRKALQAALAAQPEDPRIGELEAWKREASDKLVEAGMALSDAHDQVSTLAAQVKELRAVLQIAKDEPRRSMDGENRFWFALDEALASTEHASSEAVTQIERGALEKAAQLIEAYSVTDGASGSFLVSRPDGDRHVLHYATAIRALAEGGE